MASTSQLPTSSQFQQQAQQLPPHLQAQFLQQQQAMLAMSQGQRPGPLPAQQSLNSQALPPQIQHPPPAHGMQPASQSTGLAGPSANTYPAVPLQPGLQQGSQAQAQIQATHPSPARRPSMDQLMLMKRLGEIAQKGQGLPIQSLFTRTSWMPGSLPESQGRPSLSMTSGSAEASTSAAADTAIPEYTTLDRRNVGSWMQKDLRSVELLSKDKERMQQELDEMALELVRAQDWLGPVGAAGADGQDSRLAEASARAQAAQAHASQTLAQAQALAAARAKQQQGSGQQQGKKAKSAAAAAASASQAAREAAAIAQEAHSALAQLRATKDAEPQYRVRSRAQFEKDLSRGKRKRRPWLEFSKRDLRSIAAREETLIPIRLDIEHEGRRCSDTFTWNVNGELVPARHVRTCQITADVLGRAVRHAHHASNLCNDPVRRPFATARSVSWQHRLIHQRADQAVPRGGGTTSPDALHWCWVDAATGRHGCRGFCSAG